MPPSKYAPQLRLARLRRVAPSTEVLPRVALNDSPGVGDEIASLLESLPTYRACPSSIWVGEHAELNGEIHPSQCPACQAPLSVRLWLERADCWNCGLSLHLTQITTLPAHPLKHDPSPDRTESNRPPDHAAGVDDPPARVVSGHGAVPRERFGTEDRTHATVSPAEGRSHHRRDPLETPRFIPPRLRRRRLLNSIPAWLSSLMFHSILLALLALLTIRAAHQGPEITLALEVGREDRPGDRESLLTIDDVRFDLVLPEGEIPRSTRERKALIAAAQAARRLQLDPRSPAAELPALEQVMQAAQSADVHRRLLVMRDPRLRVQAIRREGGTTLTEAAVARGLEWLARQQRRDGSWPLNGRGQLMAGTSLALLPFLGAGQTHRVGIYQDQVSSGLRFLLRHQRQDGDLRGDSPPQFGMYVHGQATIVLCEALAMTGDERLREAAQSAVNFLVQAQHPGGGWRYEPGEEGDTSVLGWQMMALQSARAAGLEIPDEVWELADQYLETVQSDRGALYAYQPDYPPTHVMTAEALLCRMYLGWTLSDPGLRRGIRFLAQRHPPRLDAPDYYYWYYATQVLHHAGGSAWHRWNEQMRAILIKLQRTESWAAGSWDPRGPHAHVGGRIYVTSLAICTLEVYYRHAPIFRQIDLR